eukprot:3408185-Pleurochrysis_carterae.AAC.2
MHKQVQAMYARQRIGGSTLGRLSLRRRASLPRADRVSATHMLIVVGSADMASSLRAMDSRGAAETLSPKTGQKKCKSLE